MVAYYGDFAEDDTVNIPFNTFDSNDPANSVTATNLIASDIYVHKDGSATAITIDGATIDVDVNAIAGSHMITIDTSADAAYTTGSEYAVRIEGATVDAGTVNAWVGAFSIERAGGALAVVKLIQTAVITNAVGADVSADIATAQSDLDTITGAAGVIIDDSAANDTTLSDAVWDEAQSGHVGAGTFGVIASEIADILLDTAEIGTAGVGLTNLGGSSNNWNVGKTGYTLTATTGLGNQTANITGNLSGSIGSNIELGPAEVNAEVLDVLKTDTMTQSTLCPQEAPPVNATMEEAIAYLYKAWRNRSTQTATTYSLYADDATTQDQKATVSDDATTADKGEVVAGT
jgi:hypothetical protein